MSFREVCADTNLGKRLKMKTLCLLMLLMQQIKIMSFGKEICWLFHCLREIWPTKKWITFITTHALINGS